MSDKKWTVDEVEAIRADRERRRELLNSGILKKLYDRNQNVLMGSSYGKGTPYYEYIPKERMATGRPYIFCSGCSYDGGTDLSGKETVSWEELPGMFPDNTFA